jgi:hypothetical protein
VAEKPPPYLIQHWEHYDVATLWSWLSQENDRLSREQEAAWRRTHDLLDSYRAYLEGAFDALQEVWPASPGSVAETYAVQFRNLISSVTDTSRIAGGNAAVLSRLADSLMAARSRMEVLNQEYAAANGASPDVRKLVGIKRDAVDVMSEADAATHDYAAQLEAPGQFSVGSGDSGIDPGSDPDVGLIGPRTSAASTGEAGRSETRAFPGYIAAGESTSPVGVSTPGGGLTGGPGSANGPVSADPGGGWTTGPLGDQPGSGGAWQRWPAGMVPPIVGRPDPARSSTSVRPGAVSGADDPAHGGSARVGRPEHPGVGSGSDGEGGGHGMFGPAGVGGGGKTERRRRSKGDPYSQWAIRNDGWPAVLQPPDEPGDHDPGPIAFGRRP